MKALITDEKFFEMGVFDRWQTLFQFANGIYLIDWMIGADLVKNYFKISIALQSL